MPVITMLFGAALTALGVVSYTAAVEYFGSKPYSSITALIPAFLGVPLLLCGLLALNERYLKHAMHAAAMVGLLGLLGALGVAGKNIPKVLQEGTAALEKPEAFRSQVAMALLCAVFVGLCVNSFIAARRRRARAEMGR
jgi:uncharacterized membrane protein